MQLPTKNRRFLFLVVTCATFFAAAGGTAPGGTAPGGPVPGGPVPGGPVPGGTAPDGTAPAGAVVAGVIPIPRPGDREFVLDKANLIQPPDVAKIKQLADRLLTDKATPIVVVTINSMAEHGGTGMRIETFARLLFDQWGVGHAKIHDQPWNTGILLLVSKGDRKARIELGAHWRRDQDLLCDKIMNEQIIPRFKQGDFSGGIVAGVEALDKMARGLSLPGAPSGSHSATKGIPIWLIVGVIGLAVFTMVSLARKGSGGWAWILWGIVFGIIGAVLYSFLSGNRSRGSGGGFSGGSFGGGFSGGGGSTGSW